MTVKDTCDKISSIPMAKRQKTECHAKNEKPSDEMLGIIIAATRTPDMNIVDFTDDISDLEITPGQEPLSNSDLPSRRKRHKKRKRTKGEKSQNFLADSEKSQKKDRKGDPTKTSSQAKSL